MNEQFKAWALFDADNVVFYGPPPKNLFYSPFNFQAKLNDLIRREKEIRSPSLSFIRILYEFLTHAPRPPNKQVLNNIADLKEQVQDKDLLLGIGILSGRSVALLGLTQTKIEKAGYKDLFDDFFLDPGIGSAIHKLRTTRKLSNNGVEVHHFDDDATAALIVNQNNTDRGNRGLVHAFLVGRTYRQNVLDELGFNYSTTLHWYVTAIEAIDRSIQLLKRH